MTAPPGVEGLHLSPTLFESVFGKVKVSRPASLFSRESSSEEEGCVLRRCAQEGQGGQWCWTGQRSSSVPPQHLQNRHASAHLTFTGKMSGIKCIRGETQASVCDPSALRSPKENRQQQWQQLGTVLESTKQRLYCDQNIIQTLILLSFLHLPVLLHRATGRWRCKLAFPSNLWRVRGWQRRGLVRTHLKLWRSTDAEAR